MGRIKKSKILDIISLLEAANKQLSEKIKEQDFQDVLMQCQESAIIVGNDLESSGLIPQAIISEIEEYCELLYQISLNYKNMGERYKLAVRNEQFLRKIRTDIDKALPDDRKEIVFFPYKASMWDSLESVWMQHKSEANCDVFVVPIPYYDKNPDGSLGEKHYEGQLYPAYVAITDYEEYNLEERCPDIIYIHNPYDDANYVTTIEPAYYSSRLKQFTDELVYIPYFILQEPENMTKEAIEKLSHFVLVPAVWNATKVIVQSEYMKEFYIRVLLQVTGEDKREYWERIICGSGSPKIERIKRQKRLGGEVPSEWRNLMCYADGSKKKVILYNTSITTLLRYGEKEMGKIEKTLEIFCKWKDKVCVVWRPHPLLEATIKSMRPQLLERYLSIVKGFQNAKFGIYDDTADLDKTIALSDVYYGDYSSIVQLCKAADITIMIQNIDII